MVFKEWVIIALKRKLSQRSVYQQWQYAICTCCKKTSIRTTVHNIRDVKNIVLEFHSYLSYLECCKAKHQLLGMVRPFLLPALRIR